MRKNKQSLLGIFCLLVLPSALSAQMINVGSGLQGLSNSSFSRIGTSFGFSLGGATPGRGVVGLRPDGSFTPDGSIQFTQGSGSVVPAFGGYDPNSGAHIGFGSYRSNGTGFSLNLFAQQGSSTTFGSTSSNVTVPNGVPGQIFSGQMTPFVTGIIPVVGGYPSSIHQLHAPLNYVSPLAGKIQRIKDEQASGKQWGAKATVRKGQPPVAAAPPARNSPARNPQNSTATQGDISVAEILRQKQQTETQLTAEQEARIQELVRRAEIMRAKGKIGSARLYYKQAIELASGDLRSELKTRYHGLKLR